MSQKIISVSGYFCETFIHLKVVDYGNRIWKIVENYEIENIFAQVPECSSYKPVIFVSDI